MLSMRLKAARAGLGIVFAPEDTVQTDISAGRFARVLADWCTPFPGYHLLLSEPTTLNAGVFTIGGGAALPRRERRAWQVIGRLDLGVVGGSI